MNTVVKDSGGNELKKVTLTLTEKNAAVEDVTLSGLPANAAFDDSHIISDGSGKLYLWIPKDAEVVTVTVGGNKYYPKSDGSMTIGDVPEFTSPTQDVSRVVESNDYMTLTVDVTGTPAPALQWQVSRDGGKTWENIEGATEATYQAILPLSLHGAKFRCAATNKDGTTYSHTFTAYYCPAYLRGAASPMRGNGEFIQGEIATITAGFYAKSFDNTWYPVSSLTGVTAEYRWKYCRNVMPTEEEWAAIPPAGESYPITITDEMDYQSVCFHVTLTYPDNTVKTVTGYWRLNVCVTPVVTEQPQSVSAAAGDSVTFSAKLIDQYLNTLEYQWQSSTDGGQNWTDIEGAGGKSTADFWNYTPSYTIPSVTAAQSGQLFRCVLWNTNNHTGSDRVSTPPVYSEPATLTVTPPAHEHRYGDWSKDGTNHWHECTDAACPNQSESIKDKEAHVYTDDADTTCNICGYVRTVTPEIIPVSQITLNKAETSISVGNSETLTATVAPENATNKALTWASSDEDVATVAPDGTVTAVKAGAATITATAADGSGKSAVCKVTVTGDTTPPAHEHSYGDWSKDGTNHWHECTDADCPEQSESIKDKAAHIYDDDADTTCNVCGYVRTVTPPAHEHRYGDWSKDGTNHWHECTDADCPEQSESIKDKAAHIYDDDADTTCNVCGYVRTVTPPAHEHRYGDWSKDGTNHWHECTDAACPNQSESIKDKAAHVYDDDADTTCNICGYVRTVTPPAHEHRYGDWSKDGTNHWHECTDAACPNQSESIKDKAAHVYDDDADTTCNICGYVRTVTPPAHEHRYGDWSKDGTNHWHECTDAACPNQSESIKDKAAHVYDDDADTTCNICGYVRTVTPPAHEHRYGDWSKDGTNHWHECTDAACPNQSESIKDKAAHVYDDDADTTCNICGYVRTVTPEIVPVSQITLNKAETSISVGNSETLTATVAPENATNKALTWASSNEDVATVAPDGTVTAVKAGAATITATAADGSGKSAVCKVTVIGGTTPSQPGGSTGGSSGGSSSGGGGGSSSTTPTKPETATKPDGTKVETVTKPDGTKVETTTGKDGSVSKTETKKDGSSVTENKAADGSTGTVKTDKNGQTEAAAKVSGKAVGDAKKNGEAVKVPVEVEATRNSSTAPTVSIELPKGAGETKVEIPVSNVTPGTVAVLVHLDGTEEILKDSIPTEDGIQLTVDGNATVKIVDNSKGFIDTQDHWAKDEIDFVSARGLVNGMSATIYAPNASTTRAQLWTILARQNGADLTGGNTWYEKAQNWAKDKGVSDGANPNAAINRAQMVTMLWRAVGQPTAGGTANFTDVPTDSYYAQAVAWAVENGITTGVGNGHFDPTSTCTRAQIAAFLARSMK